MGTFKECIFTHADTEFLLMMLSALYPPANSVPEREHNNKTSDAIVAILHNRNFVWNDLFPYVLRRNKEVLPTPPYPVKHRGTFPSGSIFRATP